MIIVLPPEVSTLVETAGGEPCPDVSDMEYRRFHHHDLPYFADELLEAEETLVSIAWAALVRYRVPPTHHTRRWFTERRAAVTAERRLRQPGPR